MRDFRPTKQHPPSVHREFGIYNWLKSRGVNKKQADEFIKEFSEEEVHSGEMQEMVDFVQSRFVPFCNWTVLKLSGVSKINKGNFPDNKTVHLYCDGSCNNKSNDKGGYGIVLKFMNHSKEISGGSYSNTTSSRMEILAMIIGLEQIQSTYKVIVYSDSQYVVNAVIKDWVFQWEIIGFAGKKNRDLWERFLQVYRKFPKGAIEFVWIRGHDGHEENERCDVLAKEGGQSKVKIKDIVQLKEKVL